MSISYVYFIRAIGTNRVKIGYTSSSIKSRIGALSTASPFDLECEFLLPSDEPLELEKQLHTQLAKFRKRGEWFELSTGQLGAFLARCYSWRISSRKEMSRLTGMDMRKTRPLPQFELDDLSFWKTFNKLTYYPMWVHAELLQDSQAAFLHRQQQWVDRYCYPVFVFIAYGTVFPVAWVLSRIVRPASKLVF